MHCKDVKPNSDWITNCVAREKRKLKNTMGVTHDFFSIGVKHSETIKHSKQLSIKNIENMQFVKVN